LWLQEKLKFPDWTVAKINALEETHVSVWAAKNDVSMDKGYIQEDREGGVMALGTGVPNVRRNDLNAVPDDVWERDKNRFVWDAWVQHALAADGVTGAALDAAMAPNQKAQTKD